MYRHPVLEGGVAPTDLGSCELLVVHYIVDNLVLLLMVITGTTVQVRVTGLESWVMNLGPCNLSFRHVKMIYW